MSLCRTIFDIPIKATVEWNDNGAKHVDKLDTGKEQYNTISQYEENQT